MPLPSQPAWPFFQPRVLGCVLLDHAAVEDEAAGGQHHPRLARTRRGCAHTRARCRAARAASASALRRQLRHRLALAFELGVAPGAGIVGWQLPDLDAEHAARPPVGPRSRTRRRTAAWVTAWAPERSVAALQSGVQRGAGLALWLGCGGRAVPARHDPAVRRHDLVARVVQVAAVGWIGCLVRRHRGCRSARPAAPATGGWPRCRGRSAAA
jgi:hypothetical protein